MSSSPIPAKPSNVVPIRAAVADQAQRERALDVTASFIVEAPAGSGKTGLLMQRFLKLLADPSTQQPEEVLAITFTRKATAELRERILAQLRQVVGGAPAGNENPFDNASRTFAVAALERDRQMGWGLLDRPQRLNIRTIDSVCGEIAAALPLLSGSGAPRTPSERPEGLYREAARRTLLQLGGADARLDEALRIVLLHRDGSLSDCEALLARMLAAREQWGELVPLGDELSDDSLEGVVRPRLERALEQIVCNALTRATRTVPPDMLQALAWLAARLAHEPGYKGEPSPLQICANRNAPPGERAEHLDHWLALIHLLIKPSDGGWRVGFAKNHLGFEIARADVALLKQMIDEVRDDDRLREALCAVRTLPPPRYPDAQWRVAKALFRLLLRALAELKVLFAEREECDFAELSLAAKQALRSGPGAADLASAAGAALRHLLVDEMQDTSSSQYDLIQLLTRSWDGHSQTLFLVGDPKQSIYLFRQARVERFRRAMREQKLSDIPLTALYLTANFRSQANLIADFNRDFGLMFPSLHAAAGDPQAVDVPFVEAHPIRPPSPGIAGAVWHTCVFNESVHEGDWTLPQSPDVRAHREHEARAIRRVVEQWRAKPLPPDRRKDGAGNPIPWRIAVLARAREHFAPIIAEFRAQPGVPGIAGREAIPFRSLNIERLNEQTEVLDALALTRALLHPADRVAWLAVLHAPWCGLGLADLLAISGGGRGESAREPLPAVVASRRHLLSATGQQLFDRAWPILGSALGQRGRMPLPTWVERTWRSLGGDAALTARQLTNVRLFLNALAEIEQAGGRVDLAQIGARVHDLYAEPSSEPDAVELLTMHGAKGLEWDVVLVPALERRGASSRSEFLNWLELDGPSDEAASVVLAPIWGKGDEADMLYTWLKKVRADREAAERKRLFYVACTRAQEELHLFAAATRRAGSGDLYAPAGTLLDAAWKAAVPRIERGLAAAPDVAPSIDMFRRSVQEEDAEATLAIAAVADPQADAGPGPAVGMPEQQPDRPPILHRLPLSFDPRARFAAAGAGRLPYTPAAALSHAPSFERPEGSFSVRAFGNVVHRFLQAVAERLEEDISAETLLAELPAWIPRLTASLRAEGLPPSALNRLAQRSLTALQQALADPTGRWILGPRPGSYSEQALRSATGDRQEFRTDRVLLGGAEPRSTGHTHLWIVDFKTTEQGSRSIELFETQEKAKYELQLESYAHAHGRLTGAPSAIMLGLYYPLVPHFIHWPSSASIP